MLFFTLLSLFVFASAQSTQTFTWSFNTTVTTVSSCQTLGITLKNVPGAVGNPPYYLLAYEVGGTPKNTPLGSQNPTWTVTHVSGKSLILDVVDSIGNTGNTSQQLLNVTDGSTSCIPPLLKSDLTLLPNVTSTLTTCQPWGIGVTGGTPPYTVNLVPLDSPVTTNVTFGPNDNFLTYINRASPNSWLLAAVSDSAGQWGTGTTLVRTTGTDDTRCNNIQTSTTNVTQEALPNPGSSSSTSSSPVGTTSNAQDGASSSSKSNTAIVAGVCAAVGVLIVALLLVWLWRRRRQLKAASSGITWGNGLASPTLQQQQSTTQLVPSTRQPPPSNNPERRTSPAPTTAGSSTSTRVSNRSSTTDKSRTTTSSRTRRQNPNPPVPEAIEMADTHDVGERQRMFQPDTITLRTGYSSGVPPPAYEEVFRDE